VKWTIQELSMRYVAVLESPAADLAKYARCFTSDLCRISNLGGLWVMESSQFNACSDPRQVFPLADATLAVVRRILSLYHGLAYYPLSVGNIAEIDDRGHLRAKAARGSVRVIILSPTAMEEMTTLIHGQPIATAILERAQKDVKISEALKLFQDAEDRWADVYDIIEFLGGPNLIEQSGLGTRKEAREIKQTANYHRHLGRAKPFPLPSNPPTLGEASRFAKRALRQWIESRL
jgi:hypothetical protein